MMMEANDGSPGMTSLSYYTNLEANYIQQLNSEMLVGFNYDENPDTFYYDPLFDTNDYIFPVETMYNSSFVPHYPGFVPNFLDYSEFESYPKRQKMNGFVPNPPTQIHEKKGITNEEKKMSAQSIAARQRRKKITEKTQELGKLIPGGHRMNTAEMLQATFKYVKFLQAQLGILQSMESYQQENDKSFQTLEFHQLVGSSLIQEKLYSSDKCMVPKMFIQQLRN